MSFFNLTRWQRLMQQWQLSEHQPLFEALQQAYRHEERHYHTRAHISACLSYVDRFRLQLQHPEEVELALWFHDAVYDIFRSDNEAQSARWAQNFLTGQGVAEEKAERVYQLIMATRHGQSPALLQGDQAWMQDIDLAILAAEPELYLWFEQAVREEYLPVPQARYCEKRAQLFEQLLAQPQLYHTSYFREQKEAAARENLTRALTELQQGRVPGLAVAADSAGRD